MNLLKKYGILFSLICALGVTSFGVQKYDAVNAKGVIEGAGVLRAVDPTAGQDEEDEPVEEEDTEEYLTVPTILNIGKGEVVKGFPNDNYEMVVISKTKGVKKVITCAEDYIKGVKEGRCTIAFKNIDDGSWLYREDGFSYETTIVVKKAPEWIKVPKTKVTLKKGRSYGLKATYSKNSTSYSKKATITSGKDVICWKDGKIYAQAKGKGVVELKTYNGKKAKITFTVK